MTESQLPPLSIIVAIAKNGTIGCNNALIWHIPNDLQYFKQITSGHPVIMGRKTWHTLQVKPLPKRKNIILTRNTDLKIAETVTLVHSMEEALAECDPLSENFIIGGAEIYRKFLPLAQKLYITRIHKDFEGDAHFPDINDDEFQQISCSEKYFDEKSELSYTLCVYQRK